MSLQKERGEQIKVLVVSSNHMMRMGLRMILEAHPGISPIGELTGNTDVAHVINREKPDIILIDMEITDANLLGLIQEFRKSGQDSRILLLGGLSDHELLHAALCLGAHGVVLKMQPPAVLFAAIESVCDKLGSILDRTPQTFPSVSADNNDTLVPIQIPPLTKEVVDSVTSREREIIELVCKGFTNKDIADRLCISETTVRHHLTSIFGKLKVSNRQKLLIFAHQYGLIELSTSPVSFQLKGTIHKKN